MYPSYLPTFLTDSWREEDRGWMKENRSQRKTFVGILNKAVSSGSHDREKLVRSIIEGLDDEYRKLGEDTKVATDHLRYIDGAVDKARGRAGDADKESAHVEPKDNGIKPRKNVRYRWQDEPGKDNVGNAAGDGPS